MQYTSDEYNKKKSDKFARDLQELFTKQQFSEEELKEIREETRRDAIDKLHFSGKALKFYVEVVMNAFYTPIQLQKEGDEIYRSL